MPKHYENLQEYFDDAVAYLALMQRPCTVGGDGTFTCAYENEDKERCIVGQFMPPGHAALKYEGSVLEVADLYPDLIGIAFPDCYLGLRIAYELQGIHDDHFNWSKYGFAAWDLIGALAEDFDLVFTEPNMELLKLTTVT